MRNLSTSPLFTKKDNGTGFSWTIKNDNQEDLKVEIGNDVWIGAKAILISGVTVGDGAVIGAGAIVTKNVPPYAVVVGVPAKVVKARFTDDIIVALQSMKWWDWPDELIKDNIELFQHPNPTLEQIYMLHRHNERYEGK
jgi:NDP-sugar pyrophosphorylase family protein